MESEISACISCHNLKEKLYSTENEIQELKLNIKRLITYIEKNCECNFLNLEIFKEIKAMIEEWCKQSDKLAVSNDFLNENKMKSRNGQNDSFKEKDIVQEDDVGDSENIPDINEQKVSNSVSEQDYVFDENYQMYYSLSSGYYYDDKKGLLYEPQSGIYYKYDYDKKEYYKVESEDTTNNTISSMCEAVADKVNDLNLNDDSTKYNIETEEILTNETPVTKTSTDASESINEVNSLLKNDETLSNSMKDWQPEEGSNMTVADMVKQVVEEQSNMSDYIFDEIYQMYYSPSTGYYYDAVRKLLYDPSNGIYYIYNADNGSYEFYYQITPTKRNDSSIDQDINYEKLSNRKKYWKKRLSRSQNDSEALSDDNSNEKDSKDSEEEFSSPEDGEIFSSDDESNTPVCIMRSPTKGPSEKNSDVFCPPSIRAIVENSENLKIGSLILITYSGGIVGRDKTNAVFLPDICVSKMHAEIKYNYENQTYSIEDLGSQNGTFINDQRLSEAKEKSTPCLINHGDRLAFGSCKLLIHIHDGLETCDCCEPGQVLAEMDSQTEKNIFISKEDKEKSRREELRRLKKKYGLQGAAFERKSVISKEYEDKAELRRNTIGSDNPYEKTEEASVDVSMPDTNKGYQMLKKMGWKEGEALGTTNSGLLEPIPLRVWDSKAGLGSSEKYSSYENHAENKRKKKWVKAQERYFQLSLNNTP